MSRDGTEPVVPPWLHGLAAAWVAAMLWFAQAAPEAYYTAMQEDRATEWATAAFFAAAAMFALRRAWRGRAPADLMVAMFCIAAAGEEISWGQRLVGFTPPELFLANNVQQEANLHNLVEVFGQPKWTLIAVLAAYGVAAPLLVIQVAPLRRLAARLGFTAPPLALVPWFGIVITIMVLYPVRFTGEWAEALAGMLFLVAQRLTRRALALSTCGVAVLAFSLEALAARPGSAEDDRGACARAEVAALADALARDERMKGLTSRRVHRRIWSVVRDREAGAGIASGFAAAACGEAPTQLDLRRRAYFVDPWGTAYWMRIEATAGRRTLEVYTFGPNRRRDPGAVGGDDIVETRRLAP